MSISRREFDPILAVNGDTVCSFVALLSGLSTLKNFFSLTEGWGKKAN
jgi:hypothetical protein